MRRTGFTLIEVLISITIIGLLTGLLVTNVSRSLSKNRIAEDVNLLSAKIEETRLLAGSTQQLGSKPGSQVDPDSGYYAVFFPPGLKTSYGIVRLSKDLTSTQCGPGAIYNNLTKAYKPECLIEEVKLSGGVNLTNPDNVNNRLIAFQIPTQQLTGIARKNGKYQTTDPTFPAPPNWFAQLTFQDKTATVNIADYTGKLTVKYQ